MHASTAKRLAALGLLIVTLVMAVAAWPASASAEAEGVECARVKPIDDDTISILGRICDRRERPPIAVPGVSVTVEDADDQVLDEATSGEDGTFILDLPAAAAEG